MSLTTKNLTNINKVASEVHRKYVAGTHASEVFSKEKCGKIVFEYDKEKVIKHFKNMPKELQSLSNGVLLEERLVVVTKILKSEMY